MTAQGFIDSVKPLLSGLAVKADDNTLLSFLNFSKNELARDTMLWVDGEEIVLTSGTTEYTLSLTPIQILDIYDDNFNIVIRGFIDSYTKGYFQTTPNKIKINYNPATGNKLFVNYYLTPDDYSLGDTIDFPPSLYKAVRHLVLSEALSMFKGEKEMVNANNHLKTYQSLVEKFLAQTDTMESETLLHVDLIKDKGLV